MDYGQTWKDEHLQWDPADFGGVDHIRVPEELVWIPDVLLYSIANRPMFPNNKRRAVIASDGNVSIYSPQILTLNCQMKVENFPYDNQKCVIQFVPWTYTKAQVMVKADPPPKDVGQIYDGVNNDQEHPEWKFISFKVFEIISNVTLPNSGGQIVESINLSFEVEMSRRPTYYICVLALPTFVITSLCVLGIFAPFSSTGDRHEKVSLGLTTLLAIAVILNIVSDQMPKSTKLPRLGYYVLAELFVCMLTTIVAVMIMFLHQRALSKHWLPPLWLQRLLCCKLTMRKNLPRHSSPAICDHIAEKHSNGENTRLLKAFADYERSLKAVNTWIELLQDEKYLVEQWNELLNAIDMLLLIVVQIFNIIMSAFLIL
uniref:Neurotransmitter-gated ion-channel ligand-binding domain-containing protein n=1 Tax=Plectus sambesii TaxID=2011161 RepID=A0A914W4K4_9BILA